VAGLAAGCGSSSSGGAGGSDGGTAGKGAGGSAGKGAGGTTGTGGSGAGGKAMTDAGTDQGTGAGGAGAGGKIDGGGSDAPADGGGGSGDALDAAAEASGPCVASHGTGNPLLFEFNGGANIGWVQFVAHDDGHTGLTTALGASFTDGHPCPGALQLGVNFMAYPPNINQPASGAVEYFYAVSPNGLDWSGYKALHAWVKLESADLGALAGVYFYVKSHDKTVYQSAFGDASMLGDWTPLVIDLTSGNGTDGGVGTTDVQLIGFELLMKSVRPAGEPMNPSLAILTADDIWLEALPPPSSDAGTSSDATGQ